MEKQIIVISQPWGVEVYVNFDISSVEIITATSETGDTETEEEYQAVGELIEDDDWVQVY